MNGIDKIPFLSICIPTYNRANHVFSLVKDILLCKSQELEVLVLDNCSTDNTKDLLSRIEDNRFVFVQNQKNIGGLSNIVKVFNYANGVYSLLCLDRDYVESQYILPLIDSLRKNDDAVLGYSTDKYNKNNPYIVYGKGFNSVLNMAYLSKHPSGNFYKTEVFKQLKIIENINDKPLEFGFITELINAEASFFGKSMIVNYPVISPGFINAKDDFEGSKSHTYLERKNLYFMPSQRIVEFSTYMINATLLNISTKEKRILFNKIYLKGLVSSTYEYRKNLMNSQFCSHYRIETFKVSVFELLKNDFYFSISFMKQNISLTIFMKSIICLSAHYKLFYHLFRHISK